MDRWKGNPCGASRVDCLSARSQARGPGEAAPASKTRGILGPRLHHHEDRPAPHSIPRSTHPLLGPMLLSADSKRNVIGQTALPPWDPCYSQASTREATCPVAPAMKPPTPVIPSTQQQPGKVLRCPQGSPEQLATQHAVSLLQIKGPNLNLYLRYNKWVSALQAGQHGWRKEKQLPSQKGSSPLRERWSQRTTELSGNSEGGTGSLPPTRNPSSHPRWCDL